MRRASYTYIFFSEFIKYKCLKSIHRSTCTYVIFTHKAQAWWLMFWSRTKWCSLNPNRLISILMSKKFLANYANWQYVSIVPGNYLVSRRQAITWTSDEKLLRLLMASRRLKMLTLYVLNFSEEIKHIFIFHVIPPHRYDTGGWNPSPSRTRTYLFYIVNIMGADAPGRKEPGHQHPWYWPR